MLYSFPEIVLTLEYYCKLWSGNENIHRSKDIPFPHPSSDGRDLRSGWQTEPYERSMGRHLLFSAAVHCRVYAQGNVFPFLYHGTQSLYGWDSL
jgi:hypothetical protein